MWNLVPAPGAPTLAVPMATTRTTVHPVGPSLGGLMRNAGPAAADGHPPAPRWVDARLATWLTQTLDLVGRGLVLVRVDGQVVHLNRQAQHRLSGSRAEAFPLALKDGHLRAREPVDQAALTMAIQAALTRGLRKLLPLGGRDSTEATAVAVLPIADDCDAVLLSLPQPTRDRELTVQCFARQHGLTSAETAVLECLVSGLAPPDIARHKGVSLSTVRTQVAQLRAKTGSRSIRALLDRVAGLPPLVGVV